MENLRLEETEYNYLVKLVPPRGSGIRVNHVGSPAWSTQAHITTNMMMASLVAVTSKGKGVDRMEYGNGHRGRKERLTPILSLEPDEDESKYESDGESDSNQNIKLTCAGQKRPTPKNSTRTGDASTSKIRGEYLVTETDAEVIESRRASKRIRSNLQHKTQTIPRSLNSIYYYSRNSEDTTWYSARTPLRNINVQPTTSGSTEISHNDGNDFDSQPLLLGGMDGMGELQCTESVVGTQHHNHQIMETLRAMESTLNYIRNSLKVYKDTSTITDMLESPFLGQGVFSGSSENSRVMGENEFIGMVTTMEGLELLEASYQWGLDGDEYMVVDDEIIERK